MSKIYVFTNTKYLILLSRGKELVEIRLSLRDFLFGKSLRNVPRLVVFFSDVNAEGVEKFSLVGFVEFEIIRIHID